MYRHVLRPKSNCGRYQWRKCKNISLGYFNKNQLETNFSEKHDINPQAGHIAIKLKNRRYCSQQKRVIHSLLHLSHWVKHLGRVFLLIWTLINQRNQVFPSNRVLLSSLWQQLHGRVEVQRHPNLWTLQHWKSVWLHLNWWQKPKFQPKPLQKKWNSSNLLQHFIP